MRGMVSWHSGPCTEEISLIEEIEGEGTFGVADGRIVKKLGSGDWNSIGWVYKGNLRELKNYLQNTPKGTRGYYLD